MAQTINLIAGIFTYAVGISAVALLPQLPATSIVAIIGTLTVCLTVMAVFRSRLLVLASFFWGLMLGLAYGQKLQLQALPNALLGTVITVEGVVSGLPVQYERSSRFDFRVTSPGSGKLRLGWFAAPPLQAGQCWRLQLRLRRPHGFASPGAFDFEAWAAREGIQACGHVRAGEYLGGQPQGLAALRQQLALWLTQYSACDTQGVLKALLLGDKSAISPAQWALFNATGTTHLLVISGLHIGLMAVLGYGLAWLMGQAGLLPLTRVPRVRVAAIIALALACGYGVLAGLGIPVQRALVMTAIAQLGPVLGIRPAPLSLLVVALAVVLTLDPLAVTSTGFWYSFIAVATLIYGLANRVGEASPLSRGLKPQWLVFCLMAPLLAFNGQPVAFWSPLVNLLAIPFIGLLVVPLLLLSAVVGLLWPALSPLLLGGLDQLVRWFLAALALFPQSSIPGSMPDLAAMVLAVLGGFLVITPGALGLRWLAPLFFLPWLFPPSVQPAPGQAEVAVLDVGQGLAIVIRTHRHVLVYDTGDAFSERFNAADRVLIPYLRRHRVSRLDRIIISHGDKDHSGGLEPLLRCYGCSDICAGSPIPGFSAPVSCCHAGQKWQWDGVRFQILAGGGHWARSNDRSCVLKVTAEGESLLLPGDISGRVEKQLLADGAALASCILLAPHHGSRSSSSAAFIQAVNPQQVLFSSGYNNPFGHPADAVLERYRRRGVRCWDTARQGSLVFTLGAGSPEVLAHRIQYQRYWWQ